LRLAQEAINKGNLNRGDPATTIGKKKKNHHQQQWKQQSMGAGGQIQGEVWDPGGFQQGWRAHEKEIMNFSQQWSMMHEHPSTLADALASQHINVHSREGEAPTLPFLNSKYDPIGINAVRLSEYQAMPLYRQKTRSPLMADKLMALGSIQTIWTFMKLQCNI